RISVAESCRVAGPSGTRWDRGAEQQGRGRCGFVIQTQRHVVAAGWVAELAHHGFFAPTPAPAHTVHPIVGIILHVPHRALGGGRGLTHRLWLRDAAQVGIAGETRLTGNRCATARSVARTGIAGGTGIAVIAVESRDRTAAAKEVGAAEKTRAAISRR